MALCGRWPGVRIPLFRRLLTELGDSHVAAIQQEVGPPVATYHVGSHELRFANGSTLLFRHVEHENDVYSYLTAEWGALLIDQAEQFSEQALRFLRHRVRQPKGRYPEWHPIIFLSANPGGLSHQYLRDGFITPAPEGTVFTAPEDDGGLRRCYLPARLSDNPSLDATEYRRRLKGLPTHLVKAYLSGDWDYIVGSFFTEWQAQTPDGQPWHLWSERALRRKYQVPPREPFPPPDWQCWGGVDGGVADPWCVLWATRAPDGRVIVYREWYARGIQVPVQAQRLRQQLAADAEAGRPVLRRLMADPAMFNVRANLTWSDAQKYAEYGIHLTKGTNAREPGWRRVREFLSTTLDDGFPALVCVEGRCPNLVRTLPSLLADRVHPEDIAHGAGSKQDDHAVDSLRYLLMPAAAPEQRTGRIELVSTMGGDDDPDGRGGHPSQTGYTATW